MDVSQAWTPDTLAEWRRYVAYERETFQVLPQKERDALATTERTRYDEMRIREVNAPMLLLPTPAIERLARQVRVLSHMSTGAQFTARQGLAISGSQTLGKSSAALYLGREHERAKRASIDCDDHAIAPTLYVTTPPHTGPKQLMTAFTRTLGLPTPSPRVTTDRMVDQVVGVLRDLGTSMVILDEVQQLHTRAAAGMEAASLLKAFTERLPALFLYVGVDLRNSDLLAGPMGAQMQGRVTVFEMAPYSIGSAEGREQWERIIMQFEQQFPLHDHEVGTLASAGGWLFDVTGGVIGSLRTHLRKAQIEAILDGREHVSLKHLKDIPLDLRAHEERAGRLADGGRQDASNGQARVA